jgi:tripartite ATP-independent transporter DctM subunit
VLADQLGTSVGDMYAGAMAPGLLLCLFYAIFIFLITLFKPQWAPALPPEARTLRGLQLAKRVVLVMIPPLLLIFLVLGTIFLGIATPTEGGAMGAVGAIILALMNKRLDMKLLQQAMDSTVKLSTFVVFILIGARVFRIAFLGVNGDQWVEHLLTGLPGGATGFLIVVNIMVFFLAFFLDFFEIAFILVPLLAPVAQSLDINLIWFGVILGVNMQTSFMHPPFGFALFYLRSVAPKEVKSTQIYWGAVPYVLIQLVMVGLLIAFPKLVTGSLHEEVKTDANDAAAIMQQMDNAPSAELPADIPAADASASEASAPDSSQSDDLLKELTGK